MTGGLLFDLDGTLADTFEDIIEAVQRARGRLDAPPLDPREVRRHIGWGARNLIALCHPACDPLRPASLPADGGPFPIPAAQVDELLALYRQEYSRILLRRTRAYPGIPEMCRALARDGASLAVISNKREHFVRQILAGLGLVDPFRVIVGADTVGRAKPDPAPLRYAIEQMGLAAERCIMIGDGKLDLLAARAAGATGCAVAWGLTPERKLIPLGPAYLARTTPELEAWLRATLRSLALKG
jgi:phosphoglycolate phosphatase